MRISTNTIYDLGGSAVQTQQSGLFKLQNQLSSGKRVNTPSDDPIAAARALDIGQSQSVSEQLSVNADYATSALQAQEATLSSVNDILSTLRSDGVYAGNPALTQADRTALAATVRGKYAQLLSLANTSENGKYLFSGFEGDTLPFSEATPGVVTYNGDEGQRLIQVSPSRQVPVSLSGKEVFQRILNGNGTFAVTANTANTGTGVATPGSAINPGLFNTTGNTKDYSVVFAQDTSTNPPTVTYDIVTNVATTVNAVAYPAGTSLLTGVASATIASRYPRTYTEGTAISFKNIPSAVNPPFVANASAFDLGVEFSVSGTPANGDTFALKGSTQGNDIFKTVYGLINALENTSGAPLANRVQNFLQDLNNIEESIGKAITTVGTTAAEVDGHKGVNEDLIVQYKTSISHLVDLDYASASTDYALRQTILQAAQQSFIKVQGLSLFNFIQ